MKTFSFTVNGTPHSVQAPERTPLLWIIREELKLHGTKFGCGVALCGACTVLVDGRAVRSCSVALEDAQGADITTIEGLANGPALNPVQQAWVDLSVPQCGYCQSGQIMSVVGLLAVNPDPSDEDIDAVMGANLCRCGTYQRIKQAIKMAATPKETP